MIIRLSENQDAGYKDSRVSGKRTREGRDNCTIEAGRDYRFIRTNRAKPKYMIRKVPGLVEKQAEVKYGKK